MPSITNRRFFEYTNQLMNLPLFLILNKMGLQHLWVSNKKINFDNSLNSTFNQFLKTVKIIDQLIIKNLFEWIPFNKECNSDQIITASIQGKFVTILGSSNVFSIKSQVYQKSTTYRICLTFTECAQNVLQNS